MAYKFTRYLNETAFRTETDTIFVFNRLFGEPLYSWWAITIPTFKVGEITGTLTDPIQDKFDGPFETRVEAEKYVIKCLDTPVDPA